MASVQKRIAAKDGNHAGPCGAETNAERQAMDGSAESFLNALLATHCRQAKAEAAVLLRAASDRTEVLAAYPPPGPKGTALGWVSMTEKPFRKVLKSAETVVMRESCAITGGSQRYLMVVPIASQGIVRAAAAFRLCAQHPQKLLLSRARLETLPLQLDHHELQLSMKLQSETMDRLRRVFEVLDVVNRPTRFLGSAMALCNELATRFTCSRVSLGFLQGRCVQVKAMSHTDTFSREMQVVQAIEAAMEECLDQDLEVVHPAAPAAMVAGRAAAGLSERHGPSAVVSLPVRQGGEVTGVLTLERHPDQPFDQVEEIEALRLICDLCTPRLSDLHNSDRWFGARMMSEIRQGLGTLMGHEHTWAKLIALLVFLAAVLLFTLKGDYRINAAFTLKAQHQQVVAAPFDTYSKSVLVEPGDRVEAGKTRLGTLESADLRLQLAALKAEQLGYRKQMTAAMRDRKTADAQIADAQSQKAAAQIRMIEKKIEQADIVAPIDGWVISEDRKQQIGAPVKAGDILFEIASIDSLRAELHVPESSIANVTEGMTGMLASVGHPDQKVRFAIDRINPIAEVIDHQNVFRVRARINEHLDWMRPGMEGEARISAGRRSVLWIVSHRLVNWLRMKLWI